MKKVVVACIGFISLTTQQPTPPQPSALTITNTYVRRIDGDKTLKTKRHVHTHGHADKPGVDTLFWIYPTDFEGSSVVAYFASNKLVKLVETARTPQFFTENSYYLQNEQLLFVKNRQVHCPFATQRAAWDKQQPPCKKEVDCFFRGVYYFAQDTCTYRWESGKSAWLPSYDIPGGGGRYAMVPKIYPLQAARYVAVFGQGLAHRK